MRYFKGYHLLLLASLAACSKSSTTTDKVGNWIRRSQYSGVARSAAASFVINDKAYVGTGFNGTDRLNDFWMYDPDQNSWTNKSIYPGTARSGAVGFAAGNMGYVGTGYDGTNKLKDFYKYDPSSNQWNPAPIAPFGGTARYGAVAFTLKGKGYVTTGWDDNWLKDMWQYDPATDKWTQVKDIPNGKRTDASSFVIGNRAYVVMGTANNAPITDFYAYDADKENWVQLNPIDNVSDDSFDDSYNFKGSAAAAFAMRGKGYVACGTNSNAVWEYTPETDRWVQKTDFEGAGRTYSTGFTVKDRGFVVLGSSSSLYLDNMFEFDPTAAYNKND
ncbi:MAG TPA: kelch repeat-containing protein [Chitinophaga sp.]|uniref:Kelch repeat-containing protein n=1 Tax=Chitinophaga sp. TaxID=1869181 RepID=UPI002C36AC16|nr:kelch repeat-containing protein [Chitinophaga sp.]HVI47576.1 kelch repeat-containing protein [Chitinophaga sp.]